MKPILFILSLLLLVASFSARAARSCVVLQYHHFSNNTPRITSVTPAQFQAHLDYLHDQNFSVLPLRDVVLSLQHQIELPDKCVSISMDDAFLSIYQTAYPLLKARGWPFTVFVSIRAVDQRFKSIMSWDQMREMAKHGASLENHGAAHLHMIRQRKQESRTQWLARIRQDIEQAQQRLTDEIGIAPILFAWPYGEYHPDLQSLLESLGLSGFGQQSGPVWPDADMTALPRFPMAAQYADLEGFITKVNTLPLPVISALPKNPLLPIGVTRPTLQLRLAKGRYSRANLRCYLDGRDDLDLIWPEDMPDTVQVTPRFDLKPGRHRTNCTMPSSQKGRFHWYSHNWFVRNNDGGWYAEY